jgi:hypothetical protein
VVERNVWRKEEEGACSVVLNIGDRRLQDEVCTVRRSCCMVACSVCV